MKEKEVNNTVKKILAVIAVLGLLSSTGVATIFLPIKVIEGGEKKNKIRQESIKEKYVLGQRIERHADGTITLEKVPVGEETSTKALRSISTTKKSDVIGYEPNYILHIDNTPNDPNFSKQYAPNNFGQTGGTPGADINATKAWDTTTGNSSIKIAVLDTGIAYNHQDLEENTWTNSEGKHGFDFINNDSDPMDDNGHGTHVSGIACAVINNNIGIAGVANCTIMAIKIFDANGSGDVFNASRGIGFAIDNGAQIISASWNGPSYSQTLCNEISRAGSHGILFTASAGNGGTNNDITPSYPASCMSPNIIAVASTDHNDSLAGNSNYGNISVDLAAPGVNIYSTVPSGNCSLCNATGYAFLSGTSMATPHVTGAAELIRSLYPGITAEAVKARLLAGVDKIPSLVNNTLSGGRLNIFKSLEEDAIPPAAITDLAVTFAGINSIKLNWTASGDDEIIGNASFYDIRYSLNIITNENWSNTTRVINYIKPKPPGNKENFILEGLEIETPYYIAVKAIDDGGNPSNLSNIILVSTQHPTIVFSDNMENGTNGWTYIAYRRWQQGNSTLMPAHSGTKIWATNLNGTYENSADMRLISPTFNISGYIEAMLYFWHNYSTEPNYDGGVVEISTDNGTNWSIIAPFGEYPIILRSGSLLGTVPAYSGFSGIGWTQAVFNLTAHIGNNQTKIRFRFGTDGSVGNYPGWFVDDISIYGLKIESPPLPDTVPPANITNLTNASYAQNYINWTWTDPADPDFSKVMVYLDETFQMNITNGTEYYNATGLSPNTSYLLSIKTVDVAGNINQTWVNQTAMTAPLPDTTPPNSVTNLTNISYDQNYINWTWTDPADPDFSKVMVYLDETFQVNVTNGMQFYNATVMPGTYMIGIRTVDTTDNINATIVTHTATTILPLIRYINGTVLDSLSRSGIANANITANSNLSAVTNETGFYSFAVAEGEYTLISTNNDIRYYVNTITISTAGKAVVWQDIELIKKPTGTITGYIRGG